MIVKAAHHIRFSYLLRTSMLRIICVCKYMIMRYATASIRYNDTTTIETQKYNDADKGEKIRLKDLFGEDTDDDDEQENDPNKNNLQPLIPMANHVHNVPESTQQVIGLISNNDITTTTIETKKKTNTTKEEIKNSNTKFRKKIRFTNFFTYHNTNDNNNHN